MNNLHITQSEARRIIQPTSDIFARYLLSSPKNVHLTKSFINAVLEDAGKVPVTDVQILSPFNLKESIYDKETVMDVKVADITGRTYDIEIQTATCDSFWNRMTYYNNSMYNRQLGKSEKYEKLLPTTVIALLKDHIYESKNTVKEYKKLHHYSLVVHGDDRDDPYYPKGDPEQFHILELDRFDFSADALYTVDRSRQRKLTSALFHWLRFFVDGASEDFMEKYLETETAVKEAKGEYEKFLSDEQLADAQFRHEMWLHDQAQAKSDAEKAGREEGLAQGISQTARNMKNMGLSADIIIKATGLTAEQIAAL